MSDSCSEYELRSGSRGQNSLVDNYFHTNLLIDAGLFIIDILLELLEGICVRSGAVGLEYRDITGGYVSDPSITRQAACGEFS